MSQTAKEAHDLVLAGIVPTIATARSHAPSGTYTGAELATRSSRPGAYDAMAIPSLFNGRPRNIGVRDEPPAVVEHLAPTLISVSKVELSPTPSALPPAAPAPAAIVSRRTIRELTPGPRPRSISEYVPHVGSAPYRVITSLQKNGGCLTYAQISDAFDVVPGNVTAIFKAALSKGALVRHVIAGKVCLALPSFVPPEVAEALPSPAPALALQPALQSGSHEDTTAAIARIEATAVALSDAFEQLHRQALKASGEILEVAKELQLELRRHAPRSARAQH